MIGRKLGPYEVLSKLGEGGMGEVYQARDTRLDRVVAVKVILGQAAARPEFRERFEREARAISALDHPHICALYDVGHDRMPGPNGTTLDVDYLVMQFLEGETLASRLARASRFIPGSTPGATSDPSVAASKPPSGDLSGATTLSSLTAAARGPIGIDAALRYGREIALALDAAHRRGIVHRDLKPGNVMITKTGAKLLDFGLAKLAAPVSGFGDDNTRTSFGGAFPGAHAAGPITGQGAILGTLHYMSPEQIEGREADARSDIFAFGAMLFELISGRRPFESPSHAGVIAAIIGGDPPPLGDLADTKHRLPLVARRALERLLQKCLAKEPDDRWQSAADLADELAWINEERLRAAEPDAAMPAPATAVPAAPPSRTREFVWMAAAVLALAGAGVTLWRYPKPAPDPSPVNFTIAPPEGTGYATGPGFVEVSPDGQQIAFVTSADGGNVGALWVRPLGSLEATKIPNGEGAWQPVWSPNGKSIAFVSSTTTVNVGLRRIDLAGGPPLTLAPRASERPAWGTRGIVLYTGDDGRLYRVAETGGESTAVTELAKDRQEIQHAWPEFLPDGRRFVYMARSSDRTKNALYLASIDSTSRTHVVDALSMVEYVPGYLVYQVQGTLMALPFDADAGRITGEANPVTEGLQFNDVNGRTAFSLSPTGTIAYRTGDAEIPLGQFTWFDRGGKPLETIGAPGRYGSFALSPNGRRLVVSTSTSGFTADLTMIDVERGVSSRFTSAVGNEGYPVWTHDSQAVIYRTNAKGVADLAIKPEGGAVAERALLESDRNKSPAAISQDGTTLFYEVNTGLSSRLWSIPIAGNGTPVQVFPNGTDSQRNAAISPDGKWMAYVTGPPRGFNVYVQPLPPTGARERISTTTGDDPHWTVDGRQIIFITDDSRVMSVDVTTAGGQIRPSAPKELFRAKTTARQVHVDPKGERFLLLVDPRAEGEAAPPGEPLTVVVNWLSTLKKR